MRCYQACKDQVDKLWRQNSFFASVPYLRRWRFWILRFLGQGYTRACCQYFRRLSFWYLFSSPIGSAEDLSDTPQMEKHLSLLWRLLSCTAVYGYASLQTLGQRFLLKLAARILSIKVFPTSTVSPRPKGWTAWTCPSYSSHMAAKFWRFSRSA